MLRFRHKPTELAHSFFYSILVSISVLMALSTVFHSINSPDNSPFFSLRYSGLISALLVLSTLCLFIKVSFSPDIIPCGWLGSKHQLTNSPRPIPDVTYELTGPWKPITYFVFINWSHEIKDYKFAPCASSCADLISRTTELEYNPLFSFHWEKGPAKNAGRNVITSIYSLITSRTFVFT